MSDRRCNLIQLGSRVKHAASSDGEGALLSPGVDEADDMGESWEARTLRECQVSVASRVRFVSQDPVPDGLR